MATRKKVTFSQLFACALFLVATHSVYADEFRPYRPAVVLIGGIKSAMAALESEIAQLESEAVGVPSLKGDLAQAKQQLAAVKNGLGISPLESQQAALQEQFDGFAQRFFKTAQVDETFMYYALNEKITNIINDPEIKRKLDTIIRLKREIADRITSAVHDINDLGQQINIMTRNDQRGLSAIKTQLAMIQQQLTVRLLSDEAHRQMDPILHTIGDLERRINDLLALRLSEGRLNLIEQYKNRMRQYQLLLEYLRDPSIIPLTTEDKILAID